MYAWSRRPLTRGGVARGGVWVYSAVWARVGGQEEGQTPLHLAALVGTKEVVRALTEAGAPLEALGGVDITLLQHAIRHVNVGAVEALLEGRRARQGRDDRGGG
jgi:hypothetical protein